MRIEIQALAAPLNESEIKRAIDPSILSKIQGKGELRAYILAQEGTSRPLDLSAGRSVFTWPNRAIQALGNKIKTGIKFFIGHGQTNSHNQRQAVGEIVGKITKNIAGKLSAVIIGHFPTPNNTLDCDICSMEAVVDTDENNNVLDFQELSGVAIASSRDDSPAFAGARRLASIQCFDEPVNSDGAVKKTSGKDDRMAITKEDLMSAPLSMIKEAVRDRNMYPHQLFEEKDMLDDREFSKVFKDLETKNSEIEKLTADVNKFKSDNENILKDGQKKTARDRLGKLIPDGMPAKKLKFIVDRFDPEKALDLTEEGLSGYIETASEDFVKVMEIVGSEEGSGDSKNQDESLSIIDKATKALDEM